MKYDYDVVIIGGGAAGLVTATGIAGLGAKVALIEKKRLGGDCTWYGCVPSKALLKSAHIVSLIRRLDDFGIEGEREVRFNSSRVMEHVRSVVNKISQHHPAALFENRGIKVLFGAPRFINNKAIELGGETITSKRFIICTGSHPLIPAIEGLDQIDFLTNENIFDLTSLPKSIAVLGAGPIGIELSQALSRLGVEVSIIEAAERILSREDKDVANLLAASLIKEGIRIYTGNKAVKFLKETGAIAITIEDKDKKQSIINAEKVLVAIGRQANVDGLDLGKAGVKYSERGVEVDNYLKTAAKNIYACGDVVGPYQFSHMAEYQAIIALSNALFPFKQKVNYNAVPWCTFTEPELSHLGLTEEEAAKQYKNIRVYRSGYGQNDRGIIDSEEKGFAKVICDNRGYILGAHIVGARAGEIIHEYVLAKAKKLKIKELSSTIHIYPTLSEIVKRSADWHYFDILASRWAKKIIKFFICLLR